MRQIVSFNPGVSMGVNIIFYGKLTRNITLVAWRRGGGSGLGHRQRGSLCEVKDLILGLPILLLAVTFCPILSFCFNLSVQVAECFQAQE